MIRKCLLFFLSVFCSISLHSQNIPVQKESVKAFEHLDLSVSAGVLGIGVEASAPLNSFLNLRAGMHYMPKFNPKMSFGVGLEDGAAGPVSKDKFDEITSIFTGFTGCEVDDAIDMIGEPTMFNASLLLDIAPFKDKRWHLTMGVFAGPSRIAKAYNTTEDMPSLFSVLVYNKMYESAYNDEPMFVYGDKSVYLDPEIANKLIDYGRMTINIGDMADGSGSCRLMPNSESMMKVSMKVSPVRPYLGFGFGDTFKKKDQTDSRYSFAFDAGVMFWGGTPQIITQRYVEHKDEESMTVRGTMEHVDLAKDVVNIKGKAGDYVRFMKSMKVCPVLSIKFTRRLF